jgi:hypothetical protein
MVAAVPPRPCLRVPRPSPLARASTPPTGQRAPAKTDPHLSFDAEDFEEDVDLGEYAENDSNQRATLPPPLEDEDPLDVVMEALRGVRCLRAVEAASVCLAVTVRAVGCRAAIAHLWNERRNSFVVAYALGPNAHLLLNTRHGVTDALLYEGVLGRVPRVVNSEQRPPLPRHAVLGGAWSVLVAPVMDGDAIFGAIELLDPLDGSCFDDRHIAATRYATARLVALLLEAGGSIGKLVAPPAE